MVVVGVVVMVGVVCHQRSSHPATCKPAKDVSVDKTDMRYVWSDSNDLCTHAGMLVDCLGWVWSILMSPPSMSPIGQHHEE